MGATAMSASDDRAELRRSDLDAPGLGEATQAAPSDAPFVAVATAWQDAWNRHDMEALADVVAENVDFITIGGRWLKGREAFRMHHQRVHSAAVFSESSVEIAATHVQRLSPGIVLMHVEHKARGDRNPDGSARPPRPEQIFTWILTQSGGRWRVRASSNTALGPVSGTGPARQPLYTLTPETQPAPATSADTPFVAVAMAWKDAWNRHDMPALADVVAEDVDFVSVGVPWLKGREAFKRNVAQLHSTLFDTLEIRATHVQLLAPGVVLVHVEWKTPSDRTPGTPGLPSRDGIFTWILTQSSEGWRLRVSTNTVITLPQAQAQ